jgi:DNA mismatch repair protein MutL
MPRIQPLAAAVVNQIAAGEVLERPASAVKELLENSIDALATRIDVDIVAGGTELIRIVDDGEGIHPDDLPLALSSHATSKLQQAADLFDVRTFGFRGEALASMAEVSRLRLRSRQADQPHGREIEAIHGRIGTPRECGCPVGTAVEIRNLFENIPVRRKFLKSIASEFGHISEQFTRVALAHPRLHLVLKHNDKLVYQLPPVEKPLERLTAFYGQELTDQLIWVESEHAGIRLWGYVGHPSVNKSTRKQQHLFLNGRWIQDRSLQHALVEAYRGLMMVGRYPVAFLFLEMPTDQVDVNVHPTKAEVRFRDVQQLFRQLLSMLRTKFLSLDLQSPLRVPMQAPPVGWDESASPTALQVPTLVGLADSAHPTSRLQPGPQLTEFAEWAKQQLAQWSPETEPVFEHAAQVGVNEPEPDAVAEGPADAPIGRTLVPGEPVRALQIHDCYLVVETDAGMTVIDQHALHERILYEQLRQRVLSGVVEAQRLLMPATIELSAQEIAVLLEHAELLNRLGFGVEEFGKDTVILTKHPVMLGRLEFPQLVRDLAEKLDSTPSVDRRDLLDELLHMMACKAAVKAGDRLSAEEIEALLQQRHLVDDAHHCPHGRPTALTLSRTELDRQFGRLG